MSKKKTIYIAAHYLSTHTPQLHNRELWGPFTRQEADKKMEQWDRLPDKPNRGYSWGFVFLEKAGRELVVTKLERNKEQYHPHIIHLRARDGSDGGKKMPESSITVDSCDRFNEKFAFLLQPGETISVKYRFGYETETVERVERVELFWNDCC